MINFREWVMFLESKKSAIELANEFIRGKDSVWLSSKQDSWLRDVISREFGERQPKNRRIYFGDFELGRASTLNGASLLKKVSSHPVSKPEPEPEVKNSGQRIKVSTQIQFLDAMVDFAKIGITPGIHYDQDISKLSFYAKTPEIFEKMKNLAIEKNYLAS